MILNSDASSAVSYYIALCQIKQQAEFYEYSEWAKKQLLQLQVLQMF